MQEAADREKSEAALREAQRQRDAAEEQKRARDVEEREAQHKQEIAEREKAEKATQEAQRKREAAAEQERARGKALHALMLFRTADTGFAAQVRPGACGETLEKG